MMSAAGSGRNTGLALVTRPLQNRYPRRRLLAAFLVAAVAAACEPIEDVQEALFLAEPDTPREAYMQALQVAGLKGTALARDWAAAAERALAAPAAVPTPYSEAGYLAPDQPSALGLRFEARRGWRIVVDLEVDADTASLFFVEAYRAARADEDGPLLVAAADSGARPFVFEAHRDGEYIVRLQPELLRGGRYTLELRAGPSLAFPVDAADNQDVHSVFGDPRDGGARDHHGIDIFAPRGTPALAAAAGIVSRVQDTERGGKVVWMDAGDGSGDRRSRTRLYYAHLDSQLVQRGQRVRAGDTIGLIGNTGNARTTPPHLHFGVYQRGPVNPYPFVARIDTVPARIVADPAAVLEAGAWARTIAPASLISSPTGRARTLDLLPRHSAVRLAAATARGYRVTLPDGRMGFIAAAQLEPAVEPLSGPRLGGPGLVRTAPGPRAAVIDSVAGPAPVLAESGGFLLVRGDGGRIGWLAASAAGTDATAAAAQRAAAASTNGGY